MIYRMQRKWKIIPWHFPWWMLIVLMGNHFGCASWNAENALSNPQGSALFRGEQLFEKGQPKEAKAIIFLFCSMLDERQRRLYAGLESLKLGHGGDAHIASLLGMDPHTVARGRQELIGGDLRPDRVRAKGGGRKKKKKKRLKS